MTESLADPLQIIGMTLDGKYLVERVVGEGGFAVVYKATHLAWKRPVAVKAFRALADLPESARDKLVEEFIREGALLAELSERSAAIVQARDTGTLTTKSGEHVPYMILEWLDGVPLDEALADENERSIPPRSIERAVALLEPVAEALALAHRRGIAHRDVKPANIFLLGDPRAESGATKLLDFGIAKVAEDAQQMGGAFTKTGGNITAFTPAYGAPEQFSRSYGATGPWTDVFALGLVLTELVTGKRPLEGDTFVQLGFACADVHRRPTPRVLGATVPDAIERVCSKAVAIPCEERYPTVGDFWSALRAAMALTPTQSDADPSAFAATAVAPPQSTAPAPASASSPIALAGAPRRSRLWLAAAPVLLVGAGLGAWVGYGRLHPQQPIRPSPSVASPSASNKCPGDASFVPGGPFYMGTDNPPPDRDYLQNEKPAHSVRLAPFCMDRFEVTVQRYLACSDTGDCLRAAKNNQLTVSLSLLQSKAYDPLCNMNRPAATMKYPINCVNWEQAEKFCAVVGGRLPTEAEWEFAARGPDGRTYPWGDDPPGPDRANACGTECVAWAKQNGVLADFPGAMYQADDGWATLAPVGTFPAGKSRYGIEDVVGNVWEWTADYYAAYTADTRATLQNPTGPASGTSRVIRGGAWNAAFQEWARPTFRFQAAPTQSSHGIGFRCVYPPK